MNKTYS